MAFNFPDPLLEQKVTNPLTGSTYEWKEPPGKWVVTAKIEEVSEIIYEGDTPPDPRGDYKLWYSTDTLELYFWYEDENGTGAWVPTSAPITMLEGLEADVALALNKAGVAEAAANANLTTIGLLDQALADVENSLGKVTLEEVLTNGNIADHAVELTDGSDDAIIISPEIGIVSIASDLETKNPRFRLSHIDDQGHPDAHAQWEIDDKGTRNDVDLGGRIEALHVRFDNEETFTLDKTGNAAFAGKVKAQPGTKDNEAIVFSQYIALQDSKEGFHRLMWDPTITDFNGYKQDQAASVGQFCSMTGAASGVVWYYISDTDLDGRIIRLPFCSITNSPKGFQIEIYFSARRF